MAIKDIPGIQNRPKTDRDWNKFINDLSKIVGDIETDVPPSGNFVTLDTAQTITSIKDFTANPTFNTNPFWNNVNVGTQIYSLVLEASPDPNNDYVVIYDSSTDLPKRAAIGTVAGAEVNDLTASVTWANVPDANITESSVTQHEAALAITQSQVTDVTATAAELNLLDLTGLTVDWVLSADSATTASWKAQAGGAEVNDLTMSVTWANVPDANITESSVTQHEAALTVLETQITDGALLARNAAGETITGYWAFNAFSRGQHVRPVNNSGFLTGTGYHVINTGLVISGTNSGSLMVKGRYFANNNNHANARQGSFNLSLRLLTGGEPDNAQIAFTGDYFQSGISSKEVRVAQRDSDGTLSIFFRNSADASANMSYIVDEIRCGIPELFDNSFMDFESRTDQTGFSLSDTCNVEDSSWYPGIQTQHDGFNSDVAVFGIANNNTGGTTNSVSFHMLAANGQTNAGLDMDQGVVFRAHRVTSGHDLALLMPTNDDGDNPTERYRFDKDGDLAATSFNSVPLTTAGVATNYLDETGAYSVPPGSGGGGIDDELLHYWFA